MTTSSNYDFFTDQTLVSDRDPKVFLSCQIMDPFFYFTTCLLRKLDQTTMVRTYYLELPSLNLGL